MRGLNEDELANFVRLTQNKEVDIRFIEYMPFDGNKWNDKKMVPYAEMLDILKGQFDLRRCKDEPNDTSKVLYPRQKIHFKIQLDLGTFLDSI